MEKHKNICYYCGKTFYSKRVDAKTCSDTCRSLLYKERNSSFPNICTSNDVNVSKCEFGDEIKNTNVSLNQRNVSVFPINVSGLKLKVTIDNDSGYAEVIPRLIIDGIDLTDIVPDLIGMDESRIEWLTDHYKRLRLPYYKSGCTLCGKQININKSIYTNGYKVVCNTCVKFYHENYTLKRDKINPEGLSIDEAYEKYYNSKTINK